MGDGAADTTGGGTLEVVHKVIGLATTGGGHDGGVVGAHGWRQKFYWQASEKIKYGRLWLKGRVRGKYGTNE